MKKKIQLFSLKKVVSKNGTLTVAQLKKKFNIKRVFTITANKNALRGSHAHRYCSQILFCPYGKIEINIFDGTQKFIIKNSVLIALCDKKFSEKDYIRNIKIFNKLTKTAKS